MALTWVNRTKPAYMEDIDKYPIPLPADILEPVKVKGGVRMSSHFSYNSVQTHSTYVDGKITEVTEATRIKNGKGIKTVKKKNGRKIISKTLPLTSVEIKNIQTRKFMPSLFADCHGHCNKQIVKSKKTRKVKQRTKKHTK
jgi:hypothetical protein